MTAPLCTCPDRGEPDWNGRHENDCPWLLWSTRKPSISELQQRYSEGGATLAILNAAPVLLEIAAAALVRRDTECSCGAELGCFPDCARERAEQALLAALAKVNP